MTTTLANGHLARLADSLSKLKERVRAAVVAEAAKSVAEAVRALLEAALAAPGPAARRPGHDGYDRGDHGRYGGDWGDADGWDDEGEVYDAPYSPRRPAEPSVKPAPARPWGAALSVGVAVARWILLRPAPAWVAAGAGAMAAAAVAGKVARAADRVREKIVGAQHAAAGTLTVLRGFGVNWKKAALVAAGAGLAAVAASQAGHGVATAIAGAGAAGTAAAVQVGWWCRNTMRLFGG